MLSTISWEQYLLTVALIFSAYYVIIGIICYRREVTAFIRRNPESAKADQSKSTQNMPTPAKQLIGPTRAWNTTLEKTHGERVDAHLLMTAPGTGEEEELNYYDAHTSALDRLATQLMTEVNALLALQDGNKIECAALFQALFSNYYTMVGTPYEEEINTHICHTLAADQHLSVTRTEVESWWPSAAHQNPKEEITNANLQ